MAETTMPNTIIPTKSKLDVKKTFLIGLGFCSCMLAWGMYNFYIPRILVGHYIEAQDAYYRVGFFTDDNRLLWMNLIMTFDNIFAIFLQPYFGELSDRLHSKFGRRTPFLIIGIPVAAIGLFFMPYVVYLNLYWVILISFIMIVVLFNLAMAFYRAPVVALMPDLTASEHRSMANMIINVMGGVGTAVGYVTPTIMGGIGAIKNNVVGFTTFELQNFIVLDAAIFWTTGVFMLIVLGLFLIFVKEVPTGDTFWKVGKQRIEIDPVTGVMQPPKDVKKIHYNTAIEVKAIFHAKEKSAALAFLAIFLWSACDDAFGTNMSTWGTEYVYLTDSNISILNLAMMVFVLVFGLPGATLSKKKGRLWTMRVGLMMLNISYAGLIIFQEFARMSDSGMRLLGFIGVCLMIGLKAGGGGFLGIAAITVIWQLAPKDKIGSYTGLYYLFKQTGSVLAPLLTGAVLALFTPAFITSTDTMGRGVWILFNPLCLIIGILGYITMRKVKRGEIGDELSPEELAALEEEYGD